MEHHLRQIIGLTVWSVVGLLAVCRADGPYQFRQETKVGGDGGWDYLSIDAPARRLYVTHASRVVVIDLDKASVVGEIADTPGVHGLAIAPELRRGFASNGRESKVSIVDLATLKTLAKVDTGENPDAILYEPGHQEVYAFNGRSESVTVIAAKSGQVQATVPLPGKPEFAVSDPAAGRVYVNIEDRNTVVAIDTTTHRIANTWPIAPGAEATGLAIDPAQHRLFIGCHNRQLVLMDSQTGKVLTTVPIGAGVDATEYDPATRWVFSANGEGTVTIAHLDTPDKLTVVQTLVTERGARTMALDPKTHNIYLATAQFAPAPEPAAGAPRARPQPVPDTFKVLVYGLVP